MRGRHENSTKQQQLGAFVMVLGLLTALFAFAASPVAAVGGDFSLDFVAAGPFDYDHITGVGGAFDDRTIDKDTGVVEQLEGGDFECGDLVVYFTEVTVEDGAVAQTIELDQSWQSTTTSGGLTGFVDLVSAAANTVANGAEADGDSGHVTNGNEVVTIVSESNPVGLSTDPVAATISITNLEGGETFILRTVVLLDCREEPGTKVTGNVHANIDAARVVAPAGEVDVISVGQQTVPLLGAGEVALPSFTLAKVADSDVVNAGEQIGFTLTLTNTGNVALVNAVLTDPLPGGYVWSESPDLAACSIADGTLTCNFGSVEAGGVRTVHVVATTTSSPCGQLDNTGTVVTDNAGTQQASDSVTVNCAAIDIDKVASDGIDADSTSSDSETVGGGDVIGFDIVVTNGGAGTATNVQVSDTLPDLPSGADWAITPAVPGCGLSGDDNRVLSCTFASLASAASVTIHVQATTSGADCLDADNSITYPNTASVTTGNDGSDQDSASVTVDCADIDIDKKASDGTDEDSAGSDSETVNAGGVIGFDIVVTNTGLATATNVQATDTLPLLPSGADWSIVPAVTGCALSGTDNRDLSCTFASLAAGASVTIHVQANTTPADCGTYLNTASVTTGNDGSDTDDATVIVQCPDVSVSKTPDAQVVEAGDLLTFTIMVSNSAVVGTGVATGVTLSDPLPAGSPAVDWSLGTVSDVGIAGDVSCSVTGAVGSETLVCGAVSLDPGDSYTVTVTAPTTATACGEYDNLATVTVGNGADDSDAGSIDCIKPSLDVVKTADDAVVSAGDQLGFEITVSNGAGPNVATADAVVLTDDLPAGVNWSIESVSSTPVGLVVLADCAITGAVGAETLACDPVDLAPGQSFVVHVVAATSEIACAEYDNTATVTSTNAPDDQSSADIECRLPDVNVVKTPDAQVVEAGDLLTFTIMVSNSAVVGTGVATGVTLSDPLPAGSPAVDWSLGTVSDVGIAGDVSCSVTGAVGSETLACGAVSLDPGDSYTVTVTAPTMATACGEYDNLATVTVGNGADDTDAGLINCLKPGLGIIKTADPAGPVSAGDSIGFDITVSNTDGDDVATARDVELSDPLPDGVDWSIDSVSGALGEGDCDITGSGDDQVLTCDPVDLAPGDSYVVRVVADTSEDACTVYDNTATATSTNAESVEDDASVTCLLPNLVVDKVADDGVVDAGNPIGFTVTITNDGEGTAHGVVVDDDLPVAPGIAWSVDEVSGDVALTCTVTDDALDCDPFDLGPGESVTIHVTSETPGGLDNDDLPAACTTYDNTATATAENDSDGDDGSDSTEVRCPIDITIVKDGPDLAHRGDTITYTFEVTNSGKADLVTVVLTDPICDEGTIALVDDGDGDTILAVGETWEYECTRVVTATDPDPLPNTAEVVGTDVDGRTTDDTDDHVVDLIAPAIQIVKTVDDATPTIGQTVTFTYTVTNTGDTTLFDIVVVDDRLGEVGTIAELAPGASAQLTKTMVVAAASPTTNIGTATGRDVLGRSVTDDDPEVIAINPAAVLPTEVAPQVLARTGAETELLLVLAGILMIVGGGLMGGSTGRHPRGVRLSG